MLIAVTTPTGQVGRHVVDDLLRAGLRPRVLVRDADRLRPAVRAAVEVVECDLADVDAVAAATAGVEALHLVVPSPVGAPDPVAAYARLGRALAEVIAAHRIPRTVFQSSVGAERRHGVGEIDGLARVEESLDDLVVGAGLGVTHLRCGYFCSNLLLDLDAVRAGRLTTLLPLDLAQPWVAPRDVAGVAAGLLLRADWQGRRVQAVHGPADLTLPQVAEAVGEACGRPIAPARSTEEEQQAALVAAGLGPRQVAAILGMATGFLDGVAPEQRRDVTTTTPTTVGAWAHQELRPLLDAD